jgi:hypothetical protein
MFRVLFFFMSALANLFDPVAKVGNGWDPNGLTVPTDNDAGSHWDPNG